ncbi:MAG: bifunctional folylpolyglutamate synthase/dihydrofolate synthase [Eubacterium sp.]|nr:bifunctional folylpolyglutamate synthase/dihydrofolate synthase [Eubacterium sp.]
MDYSEVRNYITEKDKMGSVFDMTGITELLKYLGNPEKHIPAVHIAGTNGKGSIMAYVEQCLISAGLKVGRYISPTIYDYRERWQINKIWVEAEAVAEAITKVAEAEEEMKADGIRIPTAFEVETAATFLIFKKENVDIMLIECGMGGRLDATNVLGADTINVMAAVSRDHMKVLGDTLEEITSEKLGIVRPGSTLVSYPQKPEVINKIRDYSDENYVNLIETDPTKLNILSESYRGSHFIYKDEEYIINIGSGYQILNAITAIDVLQAIEEKLIPNIEKQLDMPIHLTKDIIKDGLEKTNWDGRFSVVSKDPLIIVDGAHNEDAWLRLKESIDKYFTKTKITFIIGVLADKEYEKMVDILLPCMGNVFTVKSDNPRALSAEKLANLIQKKAMSESNMSQSTSSQIFVEAKKDYSDAITSAIEKQKGEPIIVFGTLSISGEIIRCIESMQ